MTTNADVDGLSLGVIVPQLAAAGGAERLALQCVARWQDRHRITLYSAEIDEGLLEAMGISPAVERRTLEIQLTRQPTPALFNVLHLALITPRIWSRVMGDHDVYLGHQWRSLRIDRSPFVWYAHEPNRPSYDLYYERDSRTIGIEMATLLDGSEPTPADLRHEILHDALRQIDAGVAPARVVANSRFTAAELERTLGLRGADVVYPGVDPSGALEPRWDEPSFLAVGGLTPHKRHRLAIEALSLVPGARLEIVGRGRLERDLAGMAARLGVADRVRIRTEVDDRTLRELYARCRAVLFTPVREPFGMVALEALAAGKPLVAVDEGGFTEVVDGSCAMLVPPEPPALAAAMQALVDRPEQARRMGEAGRKLAAAWSWDRTADALEAVVLDAHREAVAGRTRATRSPAAHGAAPARSPALGVRVVVDYGEGCTEGHWRTPGASDELPRAGYYASHHESTLRRQLREIERAGFDFVLLSLELDDQRLSPHGATAVDHAIALAPELGPAAVFAVELVVSNPVAALLDASLEWIARRLRRSEHAYRIDGRALVLIREAEGRPLPPLPELPGIELRPSPDAAQGADGELRRANVAGDGALASELRRALAGPAPRAVVVWSWNDYAAGRYLEPTAREDERRLVAAREALRGVRTAPGAGPPAPEGAGPPAPEAAGPTREAS